MIRHTADRELVRNWSKEMWQGWHSLNTNKNQNSIIGFFIGNDLALIGGGVSDEFCVAERRCCSSILDL